MTPRTSRLAAASAFALALAAATAAQAQDAGPSLEIHGRIFADYVTQDIEPDGGPAFEASDERLRTARLSAESKWGDWSAKAEMNFAEGVTDWEDVTLAWKPRSGLALSAGHMKTLSLENLTSSRFTTFMERGPLNDIMGLGRTLSVQAKANGANWTAAVAASGDNMNDGGGVADNQSSLAARVTYAPTLAGPNKAHLGGWIRRRESQGPGAFNYRTRNNTNFGARYVATGGIGDGDTQLGLEAAWVRGSVSVQGEWALASIDRRTGGDADVSAGYAYASWYPTGETRNYVAKEGRFNRTKVLRPVTAGGPGALELAVRYDRADLTDVAGPLAAGEYSAWTVGANWHPHDQVRFMVNYSVSENDLRAPGVEVDVKTLQVRAQYDF